MSERDDGWLSLERPEGVIESLMRLGWLESEAPVEIAKAGEGNMNLTLRVTSGNRSVVLKQSRPWVQKYPQIPAEERRILFERRFYDRAARVPGVREYLPEVLAFDADARLMLLTDLPDAQDMTGLYGGDAIARKEVRILATLLRALHDGTEDEPDPAFANRAMRDLNHEHIFRFPLNPENGLELERFEPGLTAAAHGLQSDEGYVAEVEEAGQRYVADGPFLLHGDYYPGSWLRTGVGLRVIDPEFCFYGDRTFDVGVAMAHLVLARDPRSAVEFLNVYGNERLDQEWVARFACIEIMRRLIGVAQLPIPPTDGRRSHLLRQSREGLLSRSLEPICA